MGIVGWFKRTTFEGTIKRDLGRVEASFGLGSVRLEVQELETKPGARARKFRLNLVAKSLLSWQSTPLVLEESQMRQLREMVEAALEPVPMSPQPIHPR